MTKKNDQRKITTTRLDPYKSLEYSRKVLDNFFLLAL